jgi:hypothetical protein
MKWLVLIAVLLAGPVRGQEAAALSVREKLRTRIIETLPPSPPAKPAEDRPEQANPVLVLEPIVVSESRGVRQLEKALVDDKQRKAAEAFSFGKGGTLYRNERLEVGSWWSPVTGWQFLKFKW